MKKTRTINCEFCDESLTVIIGESGVCPICGAKYFWGFDDTPIEDIGEETLSLIWMEGEF